MFDNLALMWLALAVILFVTEALTSNLITIWFAISAFIAMLVSLIYPNTALTLVVFLVCSIILLLSTRKLVRKFVKKTKTNVATLEGKSATVTKTIDNSKGEGQISVNGIIWSAYSNDDSVIDVDKKVKILSVSGVKAVVEEITE